MLDSSLEAGSYRWLAASLLLLCLFLFLSPSAVLDYTDRFVEFLQAFFNRTRAYFRKLSSNMLIINRNGNL